MIDFSKVVREAITSQINAIHTSMPAKIVRVDKDSIDVQPLISIQQGVEYRQLPLLYNVPYLSSSFGKRGIFVKPKVGDDVLIIFTEVNIDNFLIDGNSQIADDNRKFSLSDAVAICGINSFDNVTKLNNDESVILVNENAKVSLKDNGDLVLNEGDDYAVKFNELKKQFNTLKDEFDAHVHVASLPVNSSGNASGTVNAILVKSLANIDTCKVNKVRL
jgi:hypothetical protein